MHLSCVHSSAGSKEFTEGPSVSFLPLQCEQREDGVVLHLEEVVSEGGVETTRRGGGVGELAQGYEVVFLDRFVSADLFHTLHTFL